MENSKKILTRLYYEKLDAAVRNADSNRNEVAIRYLHEAIGVSIALTYLHNDFDPSKAQTVPTVNDD